MKHFVGLHVAVKETAICIDARHMKAAVSAMPVKTDRIDARNIAFAMQVGWYRPVHLKRPEARKLRLLLSSRQMLLRTRIDLDNHIRGVLKAFGLKVGKVATGQFEAREIAQVPSPIRDTADARPGISTYSILNSLGIMRAPQFRTASGRSWAPADRLPLQPELERAGERWRDDEHHDRHHHSRER